MEQIQTIPGSNNVFFISLFGVIVGLVILALIFWFVKKVHDTIEVLPIFAAIALLLLLALIPTHIVYIDDFMEEHKYEIVSGKFNRDIETKIATIYKKQSKNEKIQKHIFKNGTGDYFIKETIGELSPDSTIHIFRFFNNQNKPCIGLSPTISEAYYVCSNEPVGTKN